MGAALAPSSPLVAPLLGISLRAFARGRAAMSGFGSRRDGRGPGARSTATPLNPLGLAGGGRASSSTAAVGDALAEAEDLLGRYAAQLGVPFEPIDAGSGSS